MSRRIYVEIEIRATLGRLWEATQRPESHQRWDLRFQRIDDLPHEHDGTPKRFRYTTAGISGTGISTGERRTTDGGATSSLRFASTHPLSFIEEGAGYWRYVPTADRIRFLTGYDYRARYRLLDRVARPLMGWATAWSFDRLRLWLETGITPERALVHAMADVGWRVAAIAGAASLHPGLGPLAAVSVLLLPPHPATPAARRCRRTPPDARSAQAPAALAGLDAA